MKKIAYIVSCILILSCSRHAENKINDKSAADMESIKSESTIVSPTEESYILLIKQKLQERLDKENLWIQHPEFKIGDSLSPLFGDPGNIQLTKIKDVLLIDSPMKINDTITKLMTQVHFSNNERDTIISIVKSSKKIIENTTFKTSEITFERYIHDSN